MTEREPGFTSYPTRSEDADRPPMTPRERALDNWARRPSPYDLGAVWDYLRRMRQK
jgi:hypothetical protein